MAKQLVKSVKHFNQALLYVAVGAAVAVSTYYLLNAFAAQKTASVHHVASLYNRGQAVNFSLTNSTKQGITLSSSAPWRVETASGKAVFIPLAAQMIVSVQPGKSLNASWDQKDNNGKQVPNGEYRVIFKYTSAKESFTEVIPIKIAN